MADADTPAWGLAVDHVTWLVVVHRRVQLASDLYEVGFSNDLRTVVERTYAKLCPFRTGSLGTANATPIALGSVALHHCPGPPQAGARLPAPGLIIIDRSASIMVVSGAMTRNDNIVDAIKAENL